MADKAIDIRGPAKRFRRRAVLEGRDMSIGAGRATVLIDQIGAGQSTLLRCQLVGCQRNSCANPKGILVAHKEGRGGGFTE